jgi:hypothetical protein
MLRTVLASLALLLATPSSPAKETFSVSVSNAPAMSVISAVADVMNVNLVVWSDPSQRTSLDERDTDDGQILAAFGKATGLVHDEAEGVHTLVPRGCRKALSDVGIVAPISDEPISLYYSAIPPAAILGLLVDLQGLRRSNDFMDPSTSSYLITVRLKEVPRSKVYKLVSAIFGMSLRQLADGSYQINQGASNSCASAAASSSDVTAAMERARRGLRTDSCPRRDHDIERGVQPIHACSTLERYALDDLAVRGSIVRSGKFIALIEAPNGITHPIKQGDYMGYHYGYTSAIDSQGLTVREIVLDEFNVYRERRIKIGWNNARHLN